MHSTIMGGSTAERFINCPGAADLSADIPDRSSAAAQEGTALHTCMEKIMEGEHWPQPAGDPFGRLPSQVDGITITNEHVELLHWCHEKVMDLINGENEIETPEGAPFQFDLEVTESFPGIEGAFGTADVVIQGFDKLIIADYKFGRGRVSADSMQMDFYAACMQQDKHQDVEVHILQPRLNNHDYRLITAEEIWAFRNRVRESIKNRRPEYKEGKWCHFCRAASICPAKKKTINDALKWRGVDVDMTLVAELEAWCSNARADALSVLENGGIVEGWKLVEKRPVTKWALDDPQIEDYLSEAGLSQEDFAPRKLVSPAQAKKLLGSVSETKVVKVSSGVTIAPETDKRADLGSRDLSSLNLEKK